MIIFDASEPPPDCPTWTCRYAACRHWLDPAEAIKWDKKCDEQVAAVESWPTPYPNCALEVANRGPQTLQVVGRLLGVTRERARQVEALAIRRLLHKLALDPDRFVEFSELIGAAPWRTAQRLPEEIPHLANTPGRQRALQAEATQLATVIRRRAKEARS